MSDADGLPPVLESKPPVLPSPVQAGSCGDEPQQPVDSPWGFWWTVVFGLCVGFAYVMAQVVIVLVVAAIDGSLTNPAAIEALATDGFVLSLSLVASAPFAVGLSGLFAWMRRGMSVAEYLGFVPVSWKPIVLGMITVMLLGAGYDWLSSMLDRPEIPDFMVNAYQTARFKPLLWFAVIVLAPLSEEIFFRGFLFKGIQSSALGGGGALVITSLIWAAIHLQYDVFNILALFLLGLLLGLFRLRTGSIIPALLMHVLQNLLATVQVAWWLAGQDPPPPLP